MSASLVWFIAGIVLMILEFVIPGLIVIFFGVGAWVAALLLLIIPFSIEFQLGIFLVSSVLSLILLRKFLVSRRRGSGDKDLTADSLVGLTGEVSAEIRPGHAGSLFLRGTTWKAESSEMIPAGEKAEVTGRDGLVLTVRKA